MRSARDFGLVIPTLNEAENLPILLDRLRCALASLDLTYEVLIVDDESNDGTAGIARKHSKSDNTVRLLVRRGQRGLAGAVMHGWQHTDAELLGVMDADLQHPPELVPYLVEKVRDGADIAIASRYTGKQSVNGLSPGRYAVSRLGTLICIPLQKNGLHIHDPLSGFFVMRRECINGLDLQPEGFKLLLEILARGNFKSVVEVPFQFGPRFAGRSKAGLMTAVHYFSLLRKLSRNAFWGTRKSA
jgi:dolichol-phosphate mannosyltransferase